jgi:hypothetical protein
MAYCPVELINKYGEIMTKMEVEVKARGKRFAKASIELLDSYVEEFSCIVNPNQCSTNRCEGVMKEIGDLVNVMEQIKHSKSTSEEVKTVLEGFKQLQVLAEALPQVYKEIFKDKYFSKYYSWMNISEQEYKSRTEASVQILKKKAVGIAGELKKYLRKKHQI